MRVLHFSRGLILALGLLVGFVAHGQSATGCYTFSFTINGHLCGPLTDPDAVVTCVQSYAVANHLCLGSFSNCCTQNYVAASTGTYPAYKISGSEYQAGSSPTYTCSSTSTEAVSTSNMATVNGPCPNCPASGQSMGLEMSGVTGTITPGVTQVCAAGCIATVSTGSSSVLGCGGTCKKALGTSTGVACNQFSTSVGIQNSSVGSCSVDSSGNSVCIDTAQPKCGQYNGDEVCPNNLANGQCEAFSSGGTMCVVAAGGSPTTPPAPNAGTGHTTTVATPAETVTTGSQEAFYYSTSSVSTSTVAPTTAGTQASGASQPSGSGSGSSGPVSVTANAANGDCAASGVNCTSSGDATLPTLSTEPDVGTSVSTFLSSIQGSPLYSAMSSISDSLPSAACPTSTIDIAYLHHTFDLAGPMCSTWTSASGALGSIMLAVFAILGALIILSA